MSDGKIGIGSHANMNRGEIGNDCKASNNKSPSTIVDSNHLNACVGNLADPSPRASKVMTFQANKFIIEATVNDIFPFLDRNQYIPGVTETPIRHQIQIVSASPTVGYVSPRELNNPKTHDDCDNVSLESVESFVSCESSQSSMKSQKSFDGHVSAADSSRLVYRTYSAPAVVNNGIISDMSLPKSDENMSKSCYGKDSHDNSLKNTDINSSQYSLSSQDKSRRYSDTTRMCSDNPRKASIISKPSCVDNLRTNLEYNDSSHQTTLTHPQRVLRCQSSTFKTPLDIPQLLLKKPDYHSRHFRSATKSLSLTNSPVVPRRDNLKSDTMTDSRNDTVSLDGIHTKWRDLKITNSNSECVTATDSISIDGMRYSQWRDLKISKENFISTKSTDRSNETISLDGCYSSWRELKISRGDFQSGEITDSGNDSISLDGFYGHGKWRDLEISRNNYDDVIMNGATYSQTLSSNNNSMTPKADSSNAESRKHFMLPRSRRCILSASTEVLSPCQESPEIKRDESTPALSKRTLFADDKTPRNRNMSFKKAQTIGGYKVARPRTISMTKTESNFNHDDSEEESSTDTPGVKKGFMKRIIRRYKSLNDKQDHLSSSVEDLHDPNFKHPSFKAFLRRGSRELMKVPTSFIQRARRVSKDISFSHRRHHEKEKGDLSISHSHNSDISPSVHAHSHNSDISPSVQHAQMGSKDSIITTNSDNSPEAPLAFDDNIEKTVRKSTPTLDERRRLRRSNTTCDMPDRLSYITAISDNSLIIDTLSNSSQSCDKLNSDCVDSTEVCGTEPLDSQPIPPPLPSTLKPSPNKEKQGTLGRRHTLVDFILNRRKPNGGSKMDITTSYSNDSGIQTDPSLYSSNESFQTLVTSVVQRPRKARPSSDISPRWSHLFDEIWVKDVPDHSHTLHSKEQHICEIDHSIESRLHLSRDERKLFSSVSLGSIVGAPDLMKLHDNKHLSHKMASQHHDRTNISSKMGFSRRRKFRPQRSSSLPDNLELFRKLRGIDTYFVESHSESLNEGNEYTSCSNVNVSDESKTISKESVNYAEALWDHVTMDSEELGFHAGDVIEVTDQSDREWWWGTVDDSEGWFPASFVRLWANQDNNDITQTQDPTQDSWLRHNTNQYEYRSNVVNEILSAEREYVKHLRDVVEGYIVTVRRQRDMFSEHRTLTIFGNIEEIYDFSTHFLCELEHAFDESDASLSEIGACFINNASYFEIYSDYCNNHPRACQELQLLYKNKKYRHFFEACRLLQDMIEIPLEGFLLNPIQKICKYPLQLAELLKYTHPQHADYGNVCRALDAMKRIARLINERKRKMENIEKIASWQSTVENWEGPDLLEHSSELIYSGEVQKVNSSGWSQDRSLFLFDHQLIYCKRDLIKRNVYVYKGRIHLDQCQTIPLNDGRDPQFNASIRHAWKIYDKQRDKCFLLCGKTEDDKVKWLKALRDERQLVLSEQHNGRFYHPTNSHQQNLPSPITQFYEPTNTAFNYSSHKPWSLFASTRKTKP